jgi:hypothetical protein
VNILPASEVDHREIEDDEDCKPLHTSKLELKTGRIQPFRMDRIKVLNYQEEGAELSQSTIRESLHLATLNDPNGLKTFDDEICN